MSPRPKRSLGTNIFSALERGGLPVLLVLVFVFFVANPSTGTVFTSDANLKNVLSNPAVTGLVALAMVIPLVAGNFDLSVSATTGVANVAMASAIGTHQWPVALGIVVVLVIGALIGLVNGFLIAGLGLNAFVVTLGVYTLLGGLVLLYTNGTYISKGIPTSFGAWGSQTWLGVPRPFVLLILVALAAWYLLMNTPFGRYLEAIGSNERAARLVGVNVDRAVWTSFVLSGIVAAAAGVLQTSRAGSASADTTSAFLLPAMTAVFLGATTLRPGQYNVWGTVIGVYFVAVSVNGFTLLGAQIWVQPVFDGAALVIAVGLTTFMKRARDKGHEGRISANRVSHQDASDSETSGAPRSVGFATRSAPGAAGE
jgi:ribose transport system permease protein